MVPADFHRYRWLFLFALTWATGLVGGCAMGVSGGVFDVAAVDEMVSLTVDTPVGTEADRIDLSSAANETVSFQLVIDAGSEPLSGLRLRLTDLTGPGGLRLPTESIELFRQVPVSVAEVPAWRLRLAEGPIVTEGIYDVLVPMPVERSTRSRRLAAGGRLAVWADVSVDRTARPGRYAGTITVTARTAGGARRTIKVPLNLEVLGFVLPDAPAIKAVGGFDHRQLFKRFLRRNRRPFEPVWMDRDDPLVIEGLGVMRQFMTLAHEHGLDLFDTALRPTLKRDYSGAVKLHWDDFDAVVKPYLDGSAFPDRLGVAAWPAPVDATWPAPGPLGGVDSRDYRETVDEIIAATADHFQQMGFADRLFYWPGRGETPDGRVLALARMIRRAEPEASILTRQMPAMSGPDLFNMFAPPAHQLAPANVARADGPLAGTYLAPGDVPFMPPLSVGAAPADLRALAWLTLRADLVGLLLPDVLDWTTDPLRPTGRGMGLFYPGRAFGMAEVLPSVRLKRLRRGLQDAAYVRLLIRRGHAETAERIVRAMARYVGLDAAGDNERDGRLYGWAADGDAWLQARQLLGAEILAAAPAVAMSAQAPLNVRLARRTFAETVGGLRVESISSRVALSDPDRMRVTVEARIVNEGAKAVDATLWLPDAPEAFTLVNRAAMGRLAPGRVEPLAVTFESPLLPADAAGKITVPIRLKADAAEPETVIARPAVLLSHRPRRPITIDGDLHDWPFTNGNSAGRFTLLGRRGQAGDAPVWATNAFVLNDDENVYIAFRCDLPAEAKLAVRPSNQVDHEQLLIIGEDMVEVIFDPGADAADPADLYSLIVKANGVQIARRGLPGESARFWPADATVAVGRDRASLFVEIAVPRAAFGSAGASRLWGVNFARFATEVHEASNWAQAPRHYYGGDTLGAMILADE